MNETTLQRMNQICEELDRLSNEEATSEGNSIRDIINSYRWVQKIVNERQLSETIFGSELNKQFDDIIKIMENLRTCLGNVQKSVEGFCELQKNNSGK